MIFWNIWYSKIYYDIPYFHRIKLERTLFIETASVQEKSTIRLEVNTETHKDPQVIVDGSETIFIGICYDEGNIKNLAKIGNILMGSRFRGTEMVAKKYWQESNYHSATSSRLISCCHLSYAKPSIVEKNEPDICMFSEGISRKSWII